MSKMLEEIRQQPESLERSLASGLRAAERLKKELNRRRPKLIVLAARGTSDNAAQFGRYLLEIATRIPVSLAAPSIFTLYGSSPDLREALVVAVSQSGESTDTNMVLEKARECGAMNVGITNEASSTLARIADRVWLVRAGREKSIAATKTYTGQLLMFYLLAYALGARIRLEELRRVPEWAAAALETATLVEHTVERYRFMEKAVVVGRGLNYANALEFGLKLMETCYVNAERFSSADFLHGPIAVVEESLPVFLFAPSGVTWPSLRDMTEKLLERKAEILIVTDSSNREALATSRQVLAAPAKLSRKSTAPEDLYTPIPYIIPAQMFAAMLAEQKGLDPDRPRALTKVTKTL